tara:strand:- start:527 stop:1453 length:927 start_codon:yes stop_codon:yes gene_type:complete
MPDALARHSRFKLNKQQHGVAMLLVLMITAVIAVVVTVYQYKNKTMVQLATQAKDHMQARARLESVKEQLIFTLSTTTLWLEGPRPELLQQLKLPADINFRGKMFNWHDAKITLTDTSGLIAAIPFNDAAWLNLLRHHQVPEPESALAALQDWYDKDEFVRLNGAEQRDYVIPGLPRNNLPQQASELAFVKNLGPYWPKLAPYITFLGSSVVNYEFSPDELLPVLLGNYRAERMLESRNGSAEQEPDLMLERSEDMNIYPSGRLRITIAVEQGDAAYRQSFLLMRARYAKRITFVAEKQPGFILTEVN